MGWLIQVVLILQCYIPLNKQQKQQTCQKYKIQKFCWIVQSTIWKVCVLSVCDWNTVFLSTNGSIGSLSEMLITTQLASVSIISQTFWNSLEMIFVNYRQLLIHSFFSTSVLVIICLFLMEYLIIANIELIVCITYIMGYIPSN